MTVTKGERALILVAGSEIEVFMLPNGEYRYSQVSAAAAIDKTKQDVGYYLTNTNKEAAQGSELISVGRTRVKGLTDKAVVQYWGWKASNGNKQAAALVTALAIESLTRRADAAFNRTKTEGQYESATTQLRLELLQDCLDRYDWVDRSTPLYGTRVITVPQDVSLEEVEVLESVGYLKEALFKGWDNPEYGVPEVVAEHQQRLSAKGLELRYNNPDEGNYQLASFTLQPVA